MRKIAAAIQEGAAAFLSREYRVIAIFVVIVATVIATFLQWQTALCFVIGAIASGRGGLPGHVCGSSRECPNGGRSRPQQSA